MDKDSLIYIAGHTGLIGSSMTKILKNKGYKNLLLKTREEINLLDQKKVENFFKKERPEYVFICAGKTGGIKANIEKKAEFIYENAQINLNLIHSSYKYKVKKLLYIGCSCMYPVNSPQPMKEEYLLTGSIESTNEPYAIAKILGLKMCQAYNFQYKTKFLTVIGGNVFGEGEKQFDEGAHVVPSLIKKFYVSKKEKLESVEIWGSGNAKRDFIYVDDFVDACIFLMENYDGDEIINIGMGKGISIKEIAEILKEITEFKGEIVFNKNMPEGASVRILDITKIKKIGWEPKYNIYNGLKMTYKWFLEKYGK
ncbi:MAG: GDP-L-fucose synthase [bacterium]|nr:GDP-L-fucose synthase [bacterium]MDW8164097.1 GDP-L-fucose synthase [Candidatus Omnitrophota bacterium]